ncbi:hypothetical protein [Streptomyces sp. NPDC001410]|uniref:hypothetical protein n=1 Tax=Streptomyces sp. NPDC001410 TaxID=3364574 RepID=UPI0036849CAB
MEDVQAAPPPEGNDGRSPLRRRIADHWNGLGVAGKVGVIGGVAAAVVGGFVAVALFNTRATAAGVPAVNDEYWYHCRDCGGQGTR